MLSRPTVITACYRTSHERSVAPPSGALVQALWARPFARRRGERIRTETQNGCAEIEEAGTFRSEPRDARN